MVSPSGPAPQTDPKPTVPAGNIPPCSSSCWVFLTAVLTMAHTFCPFPAALRPVIAPAGSLLVNLYFKLYFVLSTKPLLTLSIKQNLNRTLSWSPITQPGPHCTHSREGPSLLPPRQANTQHSAEEETRQRTH